MAKVNKSYRRMTKEDVAGLQHMRHRNANSRAFAASNGKKKAEREQCRKKGEE